MCFAACHWARVPRIVYGSSLKDAVAAGLNEIRVSDAKLKKIDGEKTVLKGGVLRRECVALFKEWKRLGGKPY